MFILMTSRVYFTFFLTIFMIKTVNNDVIESEIYETIFKKIVQNAANIQGDCLIDFEMLALNNILIYKSKLKKFEFSAAIF